MDSPQKKQKQNIFEETPKPVFIPLNSIPYSISQSIQIHSQNKNNFILNEQIKADYQKKNKNDQKNNNRNTLQNIEQKKCHNNISVFHTNNQQNNNINIVKSRVLKSKTIINFNKQKILQFFYHHKYLICKGIKKVIVYNLIKKQLRSIKIENDNFKISPFPPFIFNCVIGQYLHLYSQQYIDNLYQNNQYKLADKSNKNKINQFNKYKSQQQLKKIKRQKQISQNLLQQENNNNKQIITIKISKLQVQCICKYNNSYYMGGYNRSILPGGNRTIKRKLYYLQSLDSKINNKPKSVIKIQPNQFPISYIQIQMPYIIVYCRPYFYIFNREDNNLLLKFQKQSRFNMLLQGRYALNVLNGIGISQKNNKQTIFTYDIENTPIFGVQITEHKQQTKFICLQKTGRIFGCNKNTLFEYIPSKRITRCVKLYPQTHSIIHMTITPNNNLLVLNSNQSWEYFIEVFTIDQNTFNDY